MLRKTSIHKEFRLFLKKYLCLYLATSGLSCQVRSHSLTRDWTQGPCIGVAESQPLDHQGVPRSSLYWTHLTCITNRNFAYHRLQRVKPENCCNILRNLAGNRCMQRDRSTAVKRVTGLIRGVTDLGVCPPGPTVSVHCKAILHNTVSLVHILSSETTDFLIF